MKSFFEKKLKVYEHEFGKFIWAAMIFFGVFFAAAIFRNYVDTAFLKRYGPSHIPMMLVINGLLTFVVFGLFDKIAQKLKDHGLLALFLFCYAGLVTGLFFMIKADISIAYPILYQLLYLMESVFLVYLWNIAGDLFDARQGKRIFPLITAAQVLGTTLGNFSTNPLSGLIGRDMTLLVFAAACFLIALHLMNSARKLLGGNDPKDPKARKKPKVRKIKISEIPELVKKYPIIRYLIITGLIPNILLPIFTYQFSIIANSTFTTEAGLMSFLGMFRGGMTLVVFFLLFIMGRLYSKMGLVNSSLVHPINFTLVFAGLAGFFNIFVAAYGQFTIRLIQRAIAGPVSKVLFNIVPKEIAAWARVFVRGTVIKLAMMMGSFIMIGLKEFGVEARYLAPIGCVLALYWLYETIVFGRRYKRGLKQVILEEQIDFDLIHAAGGADQAEGHIEVNTGEVEYRVEDVVDEIEDAPEMDPKSALKLLHDGAAMSRAEAAASFGGSLDPRAVPTLVAHLDDVEVVRKAAMEALIRYPVQILPYLEVVLVNSPLRVQRAILEILRLSGRKNFDVMPFMGVQLIHAYDNLIALRTLENLEDPDDSVTMLKTYLEQHNMELLSLVFHSLWVNYADMRLMYEALRSSDASVAVEMVENSIDRDMSRYLVPLIDAVPVAEKINYGRKILPLSRDESLERVLTKLAHDEDPTSRVMACYTIGSYTPSQLYFPIIEHLLEDANPQVKQAALYAEKRCFNEVADMPDVIKKINYLRKFDIFSGMGVRELQALASITSRETYNDREVIINEGEDNSSIFLIIDGDVDIYSDYGGPEEQKKVTLGQGAFIGELSLFTQQLTNASCVAAGSAEVFVIRHHHFQEIMKIYPQIGINLCNYFAGKLRDVTY